MGHRDRLLWLTLGLSSAVGCAAGDSSAFSRDDTYAPQGSTEGETEADWTSAETEPEGGSSGSVCLATAACGESSSDGGDESTSFGTSSSLPEPEDDLQGNEIWLPNLFAHGFVDGEQDPTLWSRLVVHNRGSAASQVSLVLFDDTGWSETFEIEEFAPGQAQEIRIPDIAPAGWAGQGYLKGAQLEAIAAEVDVAETFWVPGTEGWESPLGDGTAEGEVAGKWHDFDSRAAVRGVQDLLNVWTFPALGAVNGTTLITVFNPHPDPAHIALETPDGVVVRQETVTRGKQIVLNPEEWEALQAGTILRSTAPVAVTVLGVMPGEWLAAYPVGPEGSRVAPLYSSQPLHGYNTTIWAVREQVGEGPILYTALWNDEFGNLRTCSVHRSGIAAGARVALQRADFAASDSSPDCALFGTDVDVVGWGFADSGTSIVVEQQSPGGVSWYSGASWSDATGAPSTPHIRSSAVPATDVPFEPEHWTGLAFLNVGDNAAPIECAYAQGDTPIVDVFDAAGFALSVRLSFDVFANGRFEGTAACASEGSFLGVVNREFGWSGGISSTGMR